VPDLEAGSMLVKQLLFLADAQACGILPLEVLAAIRFEASPYLLSILHFSLLYFYFQKFKGKRPKPYQSTFFPILLRKST